MSEWKKYLAIDSGGGVIACDVSDAPLQCGDTVLVRNPATENEYDFQVQHVNHRVSDRETYYWAWDVVSYEECQELLSIGWIWLELADIAEAERIEMINQEVARRSKERGLPE